jgi:hypothetical protein
VRGTPDQNASERIICANMRIMPYFLTEPKYCVIRPILCSFIDSFPFGGGGQNGRNPPFSGTKWSVRTTHSGQAHFAYGGRAPASLRRSRCSQGALRSGALPRQKGGGVTDFVGTPATSRYAERGYRRPSEALIGVATSKTTTNLLDEVQPRGGERAQFKGP